MLNADGSAGALLSSLFLSRNLRQLHYRTTHNGTVSCTVNECVAGIDNCRATGELSVQRAGSAALGGSRSPSAPAPPQTPSGCIRIGENQHRTVWFGSPVQSVTERLGDRSRRCAPLGFAVDSRVCHESATRTVIVL